MSILATILVVLAASQGENPLISGQAMSKLRDKLAERIIEVEVVQKVPDGADPAFAPKMYGQAVCVKDHAGKNRIVTSAILVSQAQKVKVRSRKNRQWADAAVQTLSEELALAELAPSAVAPCPCAESPLARLSEISFGDSGKQPTPVFSIDDPVETPNIFWGHVGHFAEPPSQEFLLSTTGLPMGHPLFGADGALVAINLRRYTPVSDKNLAVSCDQLRAFLFPEKKD